MPLMMLSEREDTYSKECVINPGARGQVKTIDNMSNLVREVSIYCKSDLEEYVLPMCNEGNRDASPPVCTNSPF
ncbi:hypothetical protein R1flu_018854 [Riccia fluitans]|uniref:Uncharacterized protein n=1 Tax=Riccia fluitans TaxID=41844 RepID=A0ABD1ZIJ3_9MARC